MSAATSLEFDETQCGMLCVISRMVIQWINDICERNGSSSGSSSSSSSSR